MNIFHYSIGILYSYGEGQSRAVERLGSMAVTPYATRTACWRGVFTVSPWSWESSWSGGGRAYGSTGTRWYLSWGPHCHAPLGGVPPAPSPGAPAPGALGHQPWPDAPEHGAGAGHGRRGGVHSGSVRGGAGCRAALLAPAARLGRRGDDA